MRSSFPTPNLIRCTFKLEMSNYLAMLQSAQISTHARQKGLFTSPPPLITLLTDERRSFTRAFSALHSSPNGLFCFCFFLLFGFLLIMYSEKPNEPKSTESDSDSVQTQKPD